MGERYLIWSNERGMWWKPERRGYTTLTHEAGQYDEVEMLDILKESNNFGAVEEVACRVPWNTFGKEEFTWAAEAHNATQG